MNNLAQVVGRMGLQDSTGFHNHAALFDSVKQSLLDLNTLLPTGSGWELTDAVQINDAGQIVGYGTYRGASHGFLLTPSGEPIPVPEPTAWAVLLLAAFGYRLVRKAIA